MGDASTVSLPAFTSTAVEEIPSTVERLRNSFFSQKTKPAEFRLQQLRKLYWAIKDHEAEIEEACQRDLGKGFYDAQLAEITWLTNDIIFTCDHLEKWMKDEKPEDIAWSNKLMSPRIRKDPLGIVLVIGAFNFPFNLTLGPVIGAIAGGNTVVVKPPENAPHSAAVMQKIIAASLDPSCYACVQGGVPETSALLAEKWDKIFFTGSAKTGAIIAKAAAPSLTPVALELGGRNPAIVTRKADPRLAARRLLWAKVMNAGQVCISQNYILADQEIVESLIAELKIAFAEFFPNGAANSPDYAKIINTSSFNRIKSMLDNTSGKIVLGGHTDPAKLYIEPTVVLVNSQSDSMLTDESFGPLIPILPVTNLDQAIQIANDIHATPLGVYAFGSKAETDKILASTRSGGASVNDGFFHGIIPTLAFGGVGDSGSGSYRGKASFDCFVHRRSVTTTPGWVEGLLAVRYPPYAGTTKFAQYARMSVAKPNFDREGKVKFGLLWYILTLGSGSATGGAFRAVVVALLAGAVKVFADRRRGAGFV